MAKGLFDRLEEEMQVCEQWLWMANLLTPLEAFNSLLKSTLFWVYWVIRQGQAHLKVHPLRGADIYSRMENA